MSIAFGLNVISLEYEHLCQPCLFTYHDILYRKNNITYINKLTMCIMYYTMTYLGLSIILRDEDEVPMEHFLEASAFYLKLQFFSKYIDTYMYRHIYFI